MAKPKPSALPPFDHLVSRPIDQVMSLIETQFTTTPQLLTESLGSFRDYAIITLDHTGIIVGWSEGAAAIFGYDADRIIGASAGPLFGPNAQGLKNLEAELKTARAGGHVTVARDYYRAHGSTFFGRGVMFPLGNEQGEVQGFVCVLRDASYLDKTEAERDHLMLLLRHEQERLQYIFEFAPAFICTLQGKDHVFELANSHYYQLVGFRDIIGKTVREAIPEVAKQGFIDILDNVMTTGEPYIGNEMPIALQRQPGAEPVERFINFVYQPMQEPDGRVTGIFVHGVDVTDMIVARRSSEVMSRRLDEQAKAFDAVLASVQDTVYTFDRDGRFTYANMRLLNLLDMTYEDIIGKNFYDLNYPPKLAKLLQAYIQRVIKTGKPITDETPFRRADNLDHFYEFIFVPIVQDGVVTGVAGSSREISQRKRTELDILERSRQAQVGADVGVALTSRRSLQDKLQLTTEAVVKHLDVAFARIWTADEAAEFLTLQASAGQYTHLDGPHSRIRVGEFKIGRIARDRRPHLTNQVVGDVEVSDQAWAKTEGMVAFAGYPLIVEDRLVGVIALFSRNELSDTTLRMLASIADEIALGISQEYIEQERQRLIRQKDDFIGIATHELKTPVTSVKVYNQVLLRRAQKSGDADSADLLSKMDRQLSKLTDLIGDLLDVTKIEAGRLRLSYKTYDFDEFIREVVAELQLTTQRHTIEIKGHAGIAVTGDRDRIEQVLTNFLSNAIKYSPQSHAIIVHVAARAKTVKVCVEDFGIGLSSTSQSHVFERFYRVSGPSENMFPGLGLGLFISSEIIKRQNGKIWVESDGKGSRFCFELPIKGPEGVSVEQPDTLA